MRRRTGFIWRERFGWHDLGAGAGPLRAGGWVQPGRPHAENAETKRRIYVLVEESGLLGHLTRLEPRPATDAELLRFHADAYLEKVERLSAGEGGEVGLDGLVPRGSSEVARLAAGAALVAVEAVLAGEVDNAYALVRPPGHHAEADAGLGFCIFNNVVLAALHARAAGVGRIAIVDWDVHHGNGAQAAFYDDPDVLTISIHQDSVFPPNSGRLDECGAGAGVGANVNLPLPPGCGRGAYFDAFERLIEPRLREHRPELLLVACGFDPGAFDPMGRQLLNSSAFGTLAERMLAVADETCDGRLVMTHEGGYHAGFVPFCGLAVLEALSGRRTEVVDPMDEPVAAMAGQDLAPHQREAVDAAIAAAQAARVVDPPTGPGSP
ncbi:MAG: class II histone deacetylase [Solirubrobacterales bacterium]